jgi:hypothetical protein
VVYGTERVGLIGRPLWVVCMVCMLLCCYGVVCVWCVWCVWCYVVMVLWCFGVMVEAEVGLIGRVSIEWVGLICRCGIWYMVYGIWHGEVGFNMCIGV